LDMDSLVIFATCKEIITKADKYLIYISKSATKISSYNHYFTLLEHELDNLTAMNAILNDPNAAVDINACTVILSTRSKGLVDKLDKTSIWMEKYNKHVQTVEGRILKYWNILLDISEFVNDKKTKYLVDSMASTREKLNSILTDIAMLKAEIASVVARVITAKNTLPLIGEAA
jgi:hypothetical protein